MPAKSAGKTGKKIAVSVPCSQKPAPCNKFPATRSYKKVSLDSKLNFAVIMSRTNTARAQKMGSKSPGLFSRPLRASASLLIKYISFVSLTIGQGHDEVKRHQDYGQCNYGR